MKEQSNLNQPEYSKANPKSYQKKEGNWQKWKKHHPSNMHVHEENQSLALPKKEKKPPYFILSQTKVIDLCLKYLTRFTASEKAVRQFLKRKTKEYQRLEKTYFSTQITENQPQVQINQGTQALTNILIMDDIQADEVLGEHEEIEACDLLDENEQAETQEYMLRDEKQSQIDQWIEAAVAKAYQIQALNDEHYALSLLKQLRNQGQSPLQIKQKMQLKGLSSTQIEQAYSQLDAIKEEQADECVDDALYACLRYAQKKRYAPFVEAKDFELRQKQLTALARRGFSYEIAKKTMALDLEEAERLLALGRI